MNFERKYISYVLLSIYLAVFVHNIVPHIHHSELADEVAHLIFNTHEHHSLDDCTGAEVEDYHHENDLARHCHDTQQYEYHQHKYNQYDVRPSEVRLAFIAVQIISQYDDLVPFSKQDISIDRLDFQLILPSWDKSAHSLRGPPALV